MSNRSKILIGWVALSAAVLIGVWIGAAGPKLIRIDYFPHPKIGNNDADVTIRLPYVVESTNQVTAK
jgi:hypothetical protein